MKRNVRPGGSGLLVAVVLLCIPGLARAQPVPPPDAITTFLTEMGIPPGQMQTYYQYMAQGLGNACRSVKTAVGDGGARFSNVGNQFMYTRQYVMQIGERLARSELGTQLPGMLRDTVGHLRSLPSSARAHQLRRLLTDGATYVQGIKQYLGPQRIHQLNQMAQMAQDAGRTLVGGGAAAGAAGAAGGTAGGAAGTTAGTAAGASATPWWGMEVGLVGFLVVAGATQAGIEVNLSIYRQAMESLGSAAEREAYNKLVDLMLSRMQAGTLQAPNGGNLGDALQLLRENLRAGRSPFAGFTSRSVQQRVNQLQRDAEAGNNTKTAYCIWYNDVGWLHVGTLNAFEAEKKRARGSEIWGGRSKEPLKATRVGEPYTTLEEAVRAVGQGIGKAERKRAPLAFPKVYYVGNFGGAERKLGFEIIRHEAFKSYLPGD